MKYNHTSQKEDKHSLSFGHNSSQIDINETFSSQISPNPKDGQGVIKIDSIMNMNKQQAAEQDLS
jgi:hypothetical protein